MVARLEGKRTAAAAEAAAEAVAESAAEAVAVAEAEAEAEAEAGPPFDCCNKLTQPHDVTSYPLMRASPSLQRSHIGNRCTLRHTRLLAYSTCLQDNSNCMYPVGTCDRDQGVRATVFERRAPYL